MNGAETHPVTRSEAAARRAKLTGHLKLSPQTVVHFEGDALKGIAVAGEVPAWEDIPGGDSYTSAVKDIPVPAGIPRHSLGSGRRRYHK